MPPLCTELLNSYVHNSGLSGYVTVYYTPLFQVDLWSPRRPIQHPMHRCTIVHSALRDLRMQTLSHNGATMVAG